MDEASKLLEYIIVPQQRLPTSYRKLSLDPPLVDQVVNLVSSVVKSEVEVVNSVSSMVVPSLPSKSEFQVVNLDSSMVDPTLPLKSEVKVAESM